MEAQKMIMIPVSQYEKMIESYDKVVAELESLRSELQKFHDGKKVRHVER